jgi:hypothetical protein
MIVMLGTGGLFTGGLVWYAWERVWIWRRLDLRERPESQVYSPALCGSGA